MYWSLAKRIICKKRIIGNKNGAGAHKPVPPLASKNRRPLASENKRKAGFPAAFMLSLNLIVHVYQKAPPSYNNNKESRIQKIEPEPSLDIKYCHTKMKLDAIVLRLT